jgi:transcriptional regulator with XRE-family HTH domain
LLEDTELAARHIELRERAGLTQEEEARIAQVSPTTISGIESGKITRPHLKTILKLARVLGVRPEELSQREIKKDQPPLPLEDAAAGREAEGSWYAAYERLGDEILSLWEDELEQKIALAYEDNLAAFFVWVQAVRDIGRPYIERLIDTHLTTGGRLAAVVGYAQFAGRWAELWRRIEEVTESSQGLRLSAQDEKALREVIEEAEALHATLAGQE